MIFWLQEMVFSTIEQSNLLKLSSEKQPFLLLIKNAKGFQRLRNHKDHSKRAIQKALCTMCQRCKPPLKNPVVYRKPKYLAGTEYCHYSAFGFGRQNFILDIQPSALS